MQRVLSTVVLLGLLLASAAAFAITEHLKLIKSPIYATQVTNERGRPLKVFSPVCHCTTDKAVISFKLRHPDSVTVTIVDSHGDVVDTVATGGGSHTAGRHIWLIATSLLSDLAWAAIGYGLVVAVGAILAGPTRPAVWVRRRLAPAFRGHVGLVYIVVGVLYLLLLLWAPTRAQTEWIPALILAAAVFAGVEVFRRQTVAEFPAEGGGTERPAPA